MQTATELKPKYLTAGDGDTFPVLDSFVTFKVVGAETGNAFTMLEGLNPPGTGVPPHRERYEDETFFVLEGTYSFLIDQETVELGPGGFVFVNRGTAHSFTNVGTTPGRILCLLTPGGIHERFMADLSALGSAGMPEVSGIIAVASTYGIEFLPPPAAWEFS
ncbi:MAG: cupin domain-containing protein [Chloroflexia bacterium]|nr:cupin domain-containing protein [Chloroflexia bacterium]